MSNRASLPPSQVPRTEELRFALVMNGGVSLAVWMGGVSFEINRLVRETHPLWRGLLELTRTQARVDVISGTSAGGVNGAALALAQTYDRGLDLLRDVWMEKGAFARLLRSPNEANPASLLDGNGFYLPALEEAFSALAADAGWRVPPQVAPMNLSLTATLLRGRRTITVDDLGSAMEDAAHRVQFRFRRAGAHGGTAAQDAFATPAHIALLARAARTSSSFPVAFEPVFWRQQDVDRVDGVEAQIDGARYLVDGGIVDNKPFEGALDAIFGMPTQGNVRRVLAYIAPDPSVSAALKDDDADEPPAMAEVAGRSLVGIPASESITDQLERIQRHNREIGRRRDALVGLARHRTPEELASLARGLFPVYRYRRVHGLVDYLLERLESVSRHAVQLTQGQASDTRVGRKTLSWLRAVLEQDDAWVNERIPRNAGALELSDDRWEWGVYSLQFLIDLLFELLRRVQRLRYLTASADEDIPHITPWPQQEGAGWERIDDRRSWSGAGDGPVRAAALPDAELAPLWRAAYDLQAKVRTASSDDERRVTRWAVSTLLRVTRERDEADTGEGARSLQHRLRVTAAAALHLRRRRDNSAQLNEYAHAIAGVFLGLAAPGARIALAASRRALAPTERQACEDLAALLRALRIVVNGMPRAVLQSALHFEVIHYAMSHRERATNALVELVQISGNSQSPLGGERLAARKLAGMQLAHFGAFYKASWRANDWMMGRLDAIERLLSVVVNPERLYRLYVGRPHQGQPPSEWVADTLVGIARHGASQGVRARLEDQINRGDLVQELRFLDREGSRIPETLPRCCALLTLRMHIEIVQREIPHVARCARDDETMGADPAGVASQLARQVPVNEGEGLSVEQAIEMFHRKPVGAERLQGEVGSDLFTRTVAQTVAITHAAAAGEASGLAPFARAFLKLLELPVLLFYWLASRLVAGSRTGAAIGAAAMAVAVTLVVLPFLVPEGALDDVQPATRFSWILLGVCVALLALRSVWVLAFLAVAVVVPVAIHWFAPDWVARVGVALMAVTWLIWHLAGLRGLGMLIVLSLVALHLLPGADALPALASSLGLSFSLSWPPVSLASPAAVPDALLPVFGLVYGLFFTVAANVARDLRTLRARLFGHRTQGPG